MRIFLTGFMGSGKTYLGKLWAEDGGLSFYDLDALIEEEERMAIPKIFEVYGEDYFREKEAAVLRNTDRFENCIIACGGGTPCFFDNAEWMKRNGKVIFLNESAENIFHHIINDTGHRPLLPVDVEELQTFIRNKYSERMSFYKQADLVLEPGQLNRNAFNELFKNLNNA
ncbi:MAG: shikimate kinase [Ferruginibacter sp.]